MRFRPKPHHVRTYGVIGSLVVVGICSYINNQSLAAALAETFGLVFFWALFYWDESEEGK